MDYTAARSIRGRSLGSLLTDKLLTNRSISGAIVSTVSDKMKARATGFKEMFDPLNVARVMTGGSRVAPALLGRMLGRDKRDISYFSGGKKTATRLNTSFSNTVGESSDSANRILEQVFQIIKQDREQTLKFRENDRSTQEERENEEQKRHEEFMQVLKEFTGINLKIKDSKKEEDGGLFGMMGGFFTSLMDKLSGVFSIFNKTSPLMKFLTSRLFGFLLNPYVLAAVSLGALAAYLYGEMRDWVKTMPDLSKLTADEARIMLEKGTPHDIKHYGRENLEKIIADEKEELEKKLSGDYLPDDNRDKYDRIIAAANEEKLAKLNLPLPAPTEFLPVSPRPSHLGLKDPARNRNWDNKFGKTHNPDGTPKIETQAKPLPAGVQVSQAGAGRGVYQLQDYQERVTAENEPKGAVFGVRSNGIPKATPIPKTIDIGAKVNENVDLRLSEDMGTNQGGTIPIVNSKVNNSSVPDQPIPSTATQRDDTPILERVLQQSAGNI